MLSLSLSLCANPSPTHRSRASIESPPLITETPSKSISFPMTLSLLFLLLFQSHSILSTNSYFPFCHPSNTTPGLDHQSIQIRCLSNQSILQIRCLSNQSILTINNISFSVHRNRTTHSTCSSIASSSSNSTLPNHRNCSIASPVMEFLYKPHLFFPNCSRQSSHRCDNNISVLHLLESGIQLTWDPNQDRYISDQQRENGTCGYNDSDPSKPFICLPSQKPSGRDQIALFSTLFAFACLLLVSAVAVTIVRWRGLRSKAGEREEDPTAIFLHRHRSSHLLPPVFTYEELESSTNLFDPKRKIGDGGFGSVYLAQLIDGQIVAVKKLHRRHAAAAAATSKSFCNEVLILSSISHPNLVKLHGYCSDPRGLCLVYDYVPNGTLADHLHGSRSPYRKGSLTWQVRVDIALQIAMAIEYLHFCVEPAIVHRDVTSSNIFIEKDMRVRVGDFGLSRLLVYTDSSPTYVWTGPQGTPGYLDPDYHRSFRLTEKSDMYSFGVVLFELITRMKAVDLRREKREVALADLVVGRIQVGELGQLIDRDLTVEGEAVGTVEAVAELGFRCVAADKDDRPDAREVVAELRRIRGRVRGQRSSTTDVGRS